MSTSRAPATLLMTIVLANAQHVFMYSPDADILYESFVDQVFHGSPCLLEWRIFLWHVSTTMLGRWMGVERTIETYEGSPTSCRPPTTQGGIDGSDQRMPEQPENAPGIDRNSQDPRDRAASSQLLLPDNNAFSIITLHQTGDASHDVLHEKCSRAGGWISDSDPYRGDIYPTLDVMTEIEMHTHQREIERV